MNNIQNIDNNNQLKIGRWGNLNNIKIIIIINFLVNIKILSKIIIHSLIFIMHLIIIQQISRNI